jgi:hypothetical protein
MTTETKNNGLFDFPHITADENKILIHIGSAKDAGSEISLGYDHYDRATGELLPEPVLLRTEDIMEAWNDSELEEKAVITAGELILIGETVYKAIITHHKYDVGENFATFYQEVSDLANLQDGNYPEWSQPAGAHDAYHAGQRVMFNGEVWESKIDNNVWSPSVYPAGWIKIE